MLPDAVLELTIRSPERRADARRWASGDPFMFTFERRGGKDFERCAATTALDDALRRATSVRVVTVVDAAEARTLLSEVPPATWSELTVRDTVDIEPFRLRVLLPEGKRQQAYAKLPDRDWVVTVQSDILALVGGSCPGK